MHEKGHAMKFVKLLAAVGLTVGFAVAPMMTPVASAHAGCGGAQYPYYGQAWCSSNDGWVRVYVKCQYSGATLFYGPKVYGDNQISTAYCDNVGHVILVGLLTGH